MGRRAWLLVSRHDGSQGVAAGVASRWAAGRCFGSCCRRLGHRGRRPGLVSPAVSSTGLCSVVPCVQSCLSVSLSSHATIRANGTHEFLFAYVVLDKTVFLCMMARTVIARGPPIRGGDG